MAAVPFFTPAEMRVMRGGQTAGCRPLAKLFPTEDRQAAPRVGAAVARPMRDGHFMTLLRTVVHARADEGAGSLGSDSRDRQVRLLVGGLHDFILSLAQSFEQGYFGCIM